jgi:hypothetical protein
MLRVLVVLVVVVPGSTIWPERRELQIKVLPAEMVPREIAGLTLVVPVVALVPRL